MNLLDKLLTLELILEPSSIVAKIEHALDIPIPFIFIKSSYVIFLSS